MISVYSSSLSSLFLTLLCTVFNISFTTATFPFTIQVGNPAYVLYPNVTGEPGLPDMSTVVINISSTLIRGYTCYGGKYAAGTVLFINGSSLSSLSYNDQNISGTQPGAADIEGAVVDPSDSSHVYGIMQ